MKCEYNRIRRVLLTIILGLAMYSSPGLAEYESEVLLFPYLETTYLTGLAANSTRDSNENDYGLDFFAAVENQQFVFLGEALVAKHEQEIERLQFGWTNGETRAWLGRFHNPIGYWNTQFHHGAFMQTSVSRPNTVEYEDDDGILPMHLAGLLVEGIREHDDSGLGYAFALAAGPELSDTLEPLDILSPNSTSGGLALALNVFRQPVIYDPSQYGLFASYTEIPAPDRDIDDVRQIIVGGYWNWQSDDWRLIGSTYIVWNRLNQAGDNSSDNFVSGYIQTERVLNNEWSIFGRLEKNFASGNDVYLALLPNHTLEKALVGIRLDLFDRHALKLEASSNRSRDERFGRFTLQWTAMF